ncbi:MAG TPA: S8 family serine peptidase [Flavipsychrobacter sp.]|nr:S8 family serine peptidase [Flavipsychrobacter sp.]
MKRTIQLPFLHIFLFVFIISNLIAFNLLAQQQQFESPGIIHLKNISLHTVPNATQWIDSIQKVSVNNPIQVLIQFSTIPTQQQRSTLQQSGVQLMDYLPEKTFDAIIYPQFNTANISTLPIVSIVNIQPDWKADNYFWKKVQDLKSESSITVLVSFQEQLEDSIIRQFVKQVGGQIEPGNLEFLKDYKIVIAAGKVKALAQWYGVKFINPISNYALLDVGSKAEHKANLVQIPQTFGGLGLLGDSVTVGVGDNVSGIYHIDLKDRIINYNPAAITHHGVHINGIVGGAGIIDPRAEGMVPHATLVDHLYDNVWMQTGSMLSNHNMTLTNNSYALEEGDCGYAGIYDVYSQALDQVETQYNLVQHTFAAGNDGLLSCGIYPAGFGTIPGGYQIAKDVLTITSIDKRYADAIDGSRGPTKDGRLKPELSADGVDVYSCIGVDVYETAGGTSMASPQVTGSLALLTQRYKQLFGNVNPRSDLLKALIVNGATDFGNPGPDFRYGFGYLNLNRSMQMLNSHQYTTNVITNGDSQTITITIPPNTSQAKVLLYWHDVPASILSSNQLVNDLDLSVKDPSGNIHLPLTLDTTAANINNIAVEKADHINNCEQVTINNPATGVYTINVKAFNVPSITQNYAVTYDFIPVGIQLTYPATASVIAANDSFQVYWDASTDSNSFTLQYSIDNGVSWNTLSNNIPSYRRYYTWNVSNISSSKCLMRLSRNGTTQVSASGSFVINPQPTLTLDSVQCPGYIRMYWNAIPNASGYEILKKSGFYMQPFDTVTALNYTFSGLSLDSNYYVAVRPLISGIGGYRSLAVSRQPDNGNCIGNFSNGDLMVQQIDSPSSGRMFTSTQLGTENLSLVVRNLYDKACDSFTIYYKVNTGAWQSTKFITIIPPDTTIIVNIPGLDFSTVGNYRIIATVNNLSATDPVQKNDTATETILNISNDPLDLSSTYFDGFETMGIITLDNDSIGISPNGHWDYSPSTDSGRLRSFVNDSITITGQRSISLDANQAVPNVQNYLTGTFNLLGYSSLNNELRLEFDYLVHGTPKFFTGNQVWVRGKDTDPWLPLYSYITSIPGNIIHSGTLSLTDAMIHSHQDFSSSFQVRFGQHDTSLIAERWFGNGVTLDNVKIYTVQHDIGLAGIVSPQPADCGLGTHIPLTVQIYNGVNQVQNNIYLFYQLDSGTIVKDTLATIAGKDTISFTFKKTMDIASYGTHKINVWTVSAGDSYLPNDSILNYVFHSEPLITSYPYLQNFEASDGFWYAGGTNSSWQYGTPASPKIHKAASGIKAWKTNLKGNYNDNERSYLYSPCFDISGLKNPMLSFSVALDLEDCGSSILCDAAYMEYSYDGVSWLELGGIGTGTNWYNDTSHQVWSIEGFTRWHVASVPLPPSTQPIRLRFALRSDPAVTFEGIAVDDIHIFDDTYSVYNGETTNPVYQNVNGNQWVDFLSSNKLLAQIQPNNQNIGNTTTILYNQTQLSNPDKTQYFLPKSFTIKSNQAFSDTAGVRLYILDSDVVAMLNDSSCISCTKAEDAYSLGITKYSDNDPDIENGTLTDNINGIYTYYPHNSITWVPYDQGYYAQVNLKSFCELWFNDGGPTGTFPLGSDYLTFNAQKVSYQNVKTDWVSYIDTSVDHYELQRSMDGINFSTIDTVKSTKQNSPAYTYIDAPPVILNGIIYYRLKWTMLNDSAFYSPVRPVNWTNPDLLISVYPNPNHDGNININWTAQLGEQMDVSITDLSGRLLFSTTIKTGEWNNLTTLHLPHYSSGIYFMRFIIGGNAYVQKIVFD